MADEIKIGPAFDASVIRLIEALNRNLQQIKTSVPNKVLEQLRANLINNRNDIMVAIKSYQEMSSARRIDLARIRDHISIQEKGSEVYKTLLRREMEAVAEIENFERILKRLHKEASAADSGLEKIAKLVDTTINKMKSDFAADMSEFITSVPRGAKYGLSAINGLIKRIGPLSETLLKASKYAALMYTAVDVLSDMFRRNMRLTTQLTSTYGTLYGTSVAAQMAFKRAIAGIDAAFYSFAEVEKIAETALAQGAFTARYFATQVRQSTATYQFAINTMALLSKETKIYSKVLGLTDEQAGQFLANLASIGAVFADIASSDTTAYVDRLKTILGSFDFAARQNIMSISSLQSLYTQFNKVTVPLGETWDTTIRQLISLGSVTKGYAESVNSVQAALLRSEAGLQQFVETLFNVGQRLNIAQAYGYGVISGAFGGATGLQELAEAAVATPMQKLGMQLSAFTKIAGSNTDLITVLLSQSGYSPEIIGILKDMMENRFGQFINLINVLNKKGLTQENFAQYAGENADAFRTIFRKMSAVESPLVQLVRITTNIYEALSTLIASLPFIKSYTPVGEIRTMPTSSSYSRITQ